VQAFPSTPKTQNGRLIATATKERFATKSEYEDEPIRRRCNRCPEEEDSEVDRREALYAMVGSLVASMSLPAAASAVYGTDANIEIPNPVETMAARVNGQCLVESLGNRECLVYLDPANKLYQGDDNGLLLGRIEKASEALATIPGMIESKKWTQVSGVLLGPLGTLVGTMKQLTNISENGAMAADLATKTKTDLYAIAQFVERKQGDKALAAHEQATQSLVAFVKSV
jgi:hypothetical protein